MGHTISEVLYEGKLVRVFCPVCGKKAYGGRKTPVCEHFMFAYLDITGEFEDVSEPLKELTKAILSQAEEEDRNPAELMLEKVKSPGVLCFSVLCGTSLLTGSLTVAFDFNAI